MSTGQQQQQGGEGGQNPNPQPVEFNPDAHADAARQHFESQGYVFQTKDEISRARQAEIDQAISKAHSDWEGALSDTIGSKRPDGVKGIDWLKSAISELKKPAPAPESGASDPKKDALIAEFTSQLNALKGEIETEKKKAKDVKSRSEYNYALKGIKFSDDSAENELISKDVNDLLKGRYTFEFDDDLGRTIAKSDGVPVMDIDTGEAFEISKLIGRDAGRYIKKSTPTPKGTGDPQPVQRKKDGTPIVNTKNDIFAEAKKAGLEINSPEWQEFVKRAATLNKIDLLD